MPVAGLLAFGSVGPEDGTNSYAQPLCPDGKHGDFEMMIPSHASFAEDRRQLKPKVINENSLAL